MEPSTLWKSTSSLFTARSPEAFSSSRLPPWLLSCSVSRVLQIAPADPSNSPRTAWSVPFKATAPFSCVHFCMSFVSWMRGRRKLMNHVSWFQRVSVPHGREGWWSSLVHSSWVVCQGLDMPWQTGCRELRWNWRISVTFKGLYLVTYFCQKGSAF